MLTALTGGEVATGLAVATGVPVPTGVAMVADVIGIAKPPCGLKQGAVPLISDVSTPVPRVSARLTRHL